VVAKVAPFAFSAQSRTKSQRKNIAGAEDFCISPCQRFVGRERCESVAHRGSSRLLSCFLPCHLSGICVAQIETPEVMSRITSTSDLDIPTRRSEIFQSILQLFAAFTGDPSNFSIGDPIRPEPSELGWKETVRMNPGEITTVIMQFNLPNLPTAAMRNAVSPRTGGKEYVWHCHIFEHEEHDMMRPLIVGSSKAKAPLAVPGGA